MPDSEHVEVKIMNKNSCRAHKGTEPIDPNLIAIVDSASCGLIPAEQSQETETDPTAEKQSFMEVYSKASLFKESQLGSKPKFNHKDYLPKTQNFIELLGSTKVSGNIPVQKPNKAVWVRVHPEIHIGLVLYHDELANEYYLVHPSVYEFFKTTLVEVTLFLAVTSRGHMFFWPVKSNSTNRANSWMESALRAVVEARKSWVRVQANFSARGYDVFAPVSPPPDPDWQVDDIDDLLEKAFSGKIVDDQDHPIIKHIQGRFPC